MSPDPPAPSATFLRRALAQAAGGDMASGAYFPAATERFVSLGRDHSTFVARMAALHEAFHAALNAGTTFGCGMIAAAALGACGDPGFDRLLDRMIGAAFRTHETYATIAGVYAAADGHYDRSLLLDYPNYLPLFDVVDAVFDLNALPQVSAICLESAARAAMQTMLLDNWASKICPEWVSAEWSVLQTPDPRFAGLLKKDVLDRARDAVVVALRNSDQPMARLAEGGLAPGEGLGLLQRSDLAAQDKVNATAFDVFAREIASWGEPPPTFDGQRAASRTIINMMVAYAGDRLPTQFVIPENLHGDRDALVVDFRQERLVLRSQGQPAVLASRSQVETSLAVGFALRNEAHHYLQLVALPKTKARQLYHPLHGQALLTDDGSATNVLTGFRRRFPPTQDRPFPLVEILSLAEPAEIDSCRGASRPSVLAIISASVLHETTWPATWLTREASQVDFLAVLIDIDPFHLLEHLASQGPVGLATASLRNTEADLPARIEAMLFLPAARPASCYLTPCSSLVLPAVADHAARHLPNVARSAVLTQEQQDMVPLAFTHLVKEEPMFGFDFWT